MKKWTGWVIKKRYYKVEVEADTWEEAREKLFDFNEDWAKPDDWDTEIYDVEEAKKEEV
jgi:hypothetical protein